MPNRSMSTAGGPACATSACSKAQWRARSNWLPTDIVVAFLALAAGEFSEDELADWFRQRIPAA